MSEKPTGNHLMKLYTEQLDCFGEVMKFLCDSDQYYIMFHISLSSRHFEQTREILNQFGVKKIKSRMEIYKSAMQSFEENHYSKDGVKVGKSNGWIVDSTTYEKLLELYKCLTQDDSFNMHTTAEGKKQLILSKVKSATGYSFKNEKGTMFHIFRELVCLERELLEKSFNRNTLVFPTTPRNQKPTNISIGITGPAKSGKKSLLFSYCFNVFYSDTIEKVKESYPMNAFVMIDDQRISCNYFNFLVAESRNMISEQGTFHTLAFTFPASEIATAMGNEVTYERDIVQPLRKLIMTYPLVPIQIILTGMDLIEDIQMQKEILEKKLDHFPHLVKVTSCSSMTQEGMKSSFDELYMSAIACKYQTCSSLKTCSVQ